MAKQMTDVNKQGAGDWTTVQVTLKKSLIARKPDHILTAQALGLKKISQVRSFSKEQFNPSILGMINKINYLLDVEYL